MARLRAIKPGVPRHKSRSVVEKTDPRAEKTRALIEAAFVALLSRRSYERIRVSDITRKAHVGRVTFYAHFASKDILLETQLLRIVMPMIQNMPGDPCLVDCTRLFEHIQHARDIYRSMTGGPARNITERIVQGAIESRIAEVLTQRRQNTPALPAFAARFVAATLLTLIAWSLEQTPTPSPGELQVAFRSLVGRALA